MNIQFTCHFLKFVVKEGKQQRGFAKMPAEEDFETIKMISNGAYG